MTKQFTCYSVVCDRCGQTYEDGECTGWDNENYAIEMATNEDWQEQSSEHYCPDCYEYSDDGEIIVKPKKENI